MDRGFWSTFKELLIIVLGMVVANAFTGFLQIDAKGTISSEFLFDIRNVLTTSTFLIIVFRFGFANIMFADELSRQPSPTTRMMRVNRFIAFVVLFLSAVILGLMSYYVNWRKFGALMYVWFIVLCFIDSVWDLAYWLERREQTYRLAWLANKAVYTCLVLLIFWTFRASFDPLKVPDDGAPNGQVWQQVFFLLIVITWASSAFSIYIGRRVFFPFLFQTEEAR